MRWSGGFPSSSGLVQLGGGKSRIEPQEGLPKLPGEKNFVVACPAKGAVLAQLLSVVGNGYLPAQLSLQKYRTIQISLFR